MGKEVTFIGPTSPVMRVLGDKIGSNLVAQKAGVSTMPWNGDGMTADLDELGNIPFEQARLPPPVCCGGVPMRRAHATHLLLLHLLLRHAHGLQHLLHLLMLRHPPPAAAALPCRPSAACPLSSSTPRAPH